MNLKQVIRVAACAGIIALCIAGAGWFPPQSAAGEERQKSPVAAHPYEVQPVDWMTNFSVLHQLRCCLLERLGLGWVLPNGSRLGDRGPVEVFHRGPGPDKFDFPSSDNGRRQTGS